jgi:uncharacterized protein YbcI
VDRAASFFHSRDPHLREGGENRVPLPARSSDRQTTGTKASAISNATVRLLNEYTGRGPTKARTYISEDLITVVLQDTLTRGERTLVRSGEIELVLASRKAYQKTMGAALTASVEEITGRKVIAFLSDNHISPDYAVETFVLAPQPHEGGERSESEDAEEPPSEPVALKVAAGGSTRGQRSSSSPQM